MELAANASGSAAPNPMVGAVIVHNSCIIGEGYHQQYGAPHAEVNAIHSVHNTKLLSKATLYVNLEPCSHFGKTPPCSDLIIASCIPRIVTGSSDPNPLVAGKGIAALRAAGCTVTEHVLEEECNRLNIRFITFHRRRRPYVVLKWAQTADGYIDPRREKDTSGQPVWITGKYEQILVHKWRSEEQAIIVGTNTAVADNPRLNLRHWHGRPPIRITLDRQLRLPHSLHLFDGTQPTLVFTEKTRQDSHNLEFITIPFNGKLPEHILNELYRRNIISLFVEGGTQLLQTFIDSGLWDEARIFTTQCTFGSGTKAPIMPPFPAEETPCGNSVLRIMQRC